jgi:hypothetical protein
MRQMRQNEMVSMAMRMSLTGKGLGSGHQRFGTKMFSQELEQTEKRKPFKLRWLKESY